MPRIYPSFFPAAAALRHTLKTMFTEMPVQSEGTSHPNPAHNLERTAIYQTEPFPSRNQQGTGRGGVNRGVNPADIEQRDNIFLKNPDSFDPTLNSLEN